VFHIAGHHTGFGHPEWLRTHPPATETAVAVKLLLAAGARMVGKTLTDELAYSLSGENMHYGTPVNPRCPQRIPGGSSNGSVVAVAGGLVDFALGTEANELAIHFRHQAMCLLCIAGLGGLPQVSLPLATFNGCPLGLSMVGRRGADLDLLKCTASVMAHTAQGGRLQGPTRGHV
jgi:Asp-tRNA(Asn)/Glu-tRNA(Gln) amidotransferase A subunit family amidase